MSKVAIKRCTDYSSAKEKITEALDLLGGITSFIKPGDTVLLKPNICDPLHPEKAATTHPLFLEAVIDIVKEITPYIIVGEQSASTVSGTTQKAFEKSGIEKVCNIKDIPLRNLQEEQFTKVHLDKDAPIETISLSSILNEVDVIINLPKLKTHGITYITNAVKNTFGFVSPDERQMLHKRFQDTKQFSEMIIHIYQKVNPSLTIVDAVIAMEGDDGPSSGRPVKLGYIILSDDGFSADKVCAKLTGHEPMKIPTIRYAEKIIREKQIELLGDQPQPIAFKKHIHYKKEKSYPSINDNCTNCKECSKNCPTDAIRDEKEFLEIDYNKCIQCYICLEVCQHEAIELTYAEDYHKNIQRSLNQKNEVMGTSDILRLGKKCNQACIYCTAKDSYNFNISTEEAKDNIDTLLRKGKGTICFTGGEPTIRKDILEVLAYAKESGAKVELQTNGSTLENKEVRLLLDKQIIDTILISFPSHIKKIHQNITQSDNYGETLKGITMLTSRYDIPIMISHVINRYNAPHLVEFARFIKERLNSIKIYLSFVRPNPFLDNNKEIVPSLVEIELELYRFFDYCTKNNIKFFIEGIPLCYMRGYEYTNAESIRMKDIPSIQIEDLEITEDAHSDRILLDKKSSKDCSVCFVRKKCPRVWKEYAELYGTEELFPIFDRK
jgi:uncharacterized protein (DUF362 family)/MoaA/NifB/PqqE/SkfB family radical SAM enzyme